MTQDFVLSEVKRMIRDGEIRDVRTVRLLRRKIRSSRQLSRREFNG